MTEITESSGNIFEDLGLEDANELTLKAILAMQVNSIIAHRGLSQAEAGDLLGIVQPKVSNLRNGKLEGISVERLMHFLLRLGRDVDIIVGKKAVRSRPARIRVEAGNRKVSAAS